MSGRIMVDSASFSERNPNYFFLHLDDKSTDDGRWHWGDASDDSANDAFEPSREVARHKTPCSTQDLLVCSEIVYAFCFQRKR